MAIPNELIGILFREKGRLPDRVSGAGSTFNFWISDASTRKGTVEYSKRIIASIADDWLSSIGKVIVIGDGVGDVRFFLNISNEIQVLAPTVTVEGHFLSHSEIDDIVSAQPRFCKYKSWEQVVRGVEISIRESNSLVFLDVDRTTLFPRGVADSLYEEIRCSAILAFVNSYREVPLTPAQASDVLRVFAHVSENLSDYKNLLRPQFFKNEEVVAVVTLAIVAGLIFETFIFAHKAWDFDTVVKFSAAQTRRGGWISSLEPHEKATTIWDQDKLRVEFSEIERRIGSRDPVLSECFRRCEAVLIRNAIALSPSPINWPILDVLRMGQDTAVILVSDKPSAALGVASYGETEVFGHFFDLVSGHLSSG